MASSSMICATPPPTRNWMEGALGTRPDSVAAGHRVGTIGRPSSAVEPQAGTSVQMGVNDPLLLFGNVRCCDQERDNRGGPAAAHWRQRVVLTAAMLGCG
jgi:hypothetical protein